MYQLSEQQRLPVVTQNGSTKAPIVSFWNFYNSRGFNIRLFQREHTGIIPFPMSFHQLSGIQNADELTAISDILQLRLFAQGRKGRIEILEAMIGVFAAGKVFLIPFQGFQRVLCSADLLPDFLLLSVEPVYGIVHVVVLQDSLDLGQMKAAFQQIPRAVDVVKLREGKVSVSGFWINILRCNQPDIAIVPQHLG